MFNWHYPSVNPSPPPPAPPFWFPSPRRSHLSALWSVSVLFFLVSFIFASLFLPAPFFPLPPPPPRLSPARSGVRPLYTNNRVPVLQRCPKEPPSPSRFKEATRRGPDRECEGAAAPGGGHCLTPRAVPGEKERPGGRKRPPTSASEQQEEEEEERDRASHAEKRARIAAGEYHCYSHSFQLKALFFFFFIIDFMLSSKSCCSVRRHKWPTCQD